MRKHTFSAMWTEQLGKAILAEAPDHYEMDLVYSEAQLVCNAINQGIDAHLEACFCPDRGDSHSVRDARFTGRRNMFKISRESLPVLVRRLMEDGGEQGELLASGICETIGIELV